MRGRTPRRGGHAASPSQPPVSRTQRDAVGWQVEPTIFLTGDVSLEAVHSFMDDVRKLVAVHGGFVAGVDCGHVNAQGQPALPPHVAAG